VAGESIGVDIKLAGVRGEADFIEVEIVVILVKSFCFTLSLS
jgi:hypothetical protein